jgi:hypothetical protein
MKRIQRYRRWLFAPLVYLAALFLLLEEWLWRTGARLTRGWADWPPLRALERRIAALPPYAALAVFVLPALLLFPVKLLALLAMAQGHAVAGLGVIVAAKLGGAAAVARLYTLTRPTLLRLAWFARWHGAFIALKDRWIARLYAGKPWRTVAALGYFLRRMLRRWRTARAERAVLGRLRSRPVRVVQRFSTLWRSRRR